MTRVRNRQLTPCSDPGIKIAVPMSKPETIGDDKRLLTQEELANHLAAMAEDVRSGDSFEGSIEYECLGKDGYRVKSHHRIGNRQGQGGIRIIDVGNREP